MGFPNPQLQASQATLRHPALCLMAKTPVLQGKFLIEGLHLQVTVWSTKEETNQWGAPTQLSVASLKAMQQVDHGYLARDQQALHLDTPSLPSAMISHELSILPFFAQVSSFLSFHFSR